MTLESNYLKLLKEINSFSKHLTLIAVTKGRALEDVLALYAIGCRDFGENRLPEAFEKMKKAPSDIRWHFIGTLQRKKVPKIIGKFHLIHSVDTFELAEKISECALKQGVVENILLQANTSGEEAKQGLYQQEWLSLQEQLKKLKGIHIKGFMSMAPIQVSESEISACFADLKKLQDDFKEDYPYLSMGMSQDYPLAIKQGATHLRIGSALYTR